MQQLLTQQHPATLGPYKHETDCEFFVIWLTYFVYESFICQMMKCVIHVYSLVLGSSHMVEPLTVQLHQPVPSFFQLSVNCTFLVLSGRM